MGIRDVWPFKKKRMLTDREHVRGQLAMELASATSLTAFLREGINRGWAAKITVEIDGVSCEIGVLAYAGEPLMEYMANWAAAEKIAKHIRLEEFDRGERICGKEVAKTPELGESQNKTNRDGGEDDLPFGWRGRDEGL